MLGSGRILGSKRYVPHDSEREDMPNQGERAGGSAGNMMSDALVEVKSRWDPCIRDRIKYTCLDFSCSIDIKPM